jgi:hypothetical protein
LAQQAKVSTIERHAHGTRIARAQYNALACRPGFFGPGF